MIFFVSYAVEKKGDLAFNSSAAPMEILVPRTIGRAPSLGAILGQVILLLPTVTIVITVNTYIVLYARHCKYCNLYNPHNTLREVLF